MACAGRSGANRRKNFGAIVCERCTAAKICAGWRNHAGDRRMTSQSHFSPIAEALAMRVSHATVIRHDEPMSKHTTLRVGGPADIYVEPATEKDLAAVLKVLRKHSVKCFILGRGSNLIVRDGGFRGA